MSKRTTLFPAALASLALFTLPVAAATFDVTSNLWGDVSTPNTFAWAIQQANANSGADVIRLFSDVNVDQANPKEPISGFLTELTDPAGLSIQGNGHSLVGNPFFITSQPGIVDKNAPRPYSPMGGDMLQIEALSFARIADNVSNVTIDRLTVDGLNAFLDIGKSSTVTILDSTIKNAVSFGREARSVLSVAEGATLNLEEVVMRKINPFDQRSLGTEFFWFVPAISGNDATLNMFKSNLDLALTSSTSGAVSWAGGTANIVSSTILGQGLSVSKLSQPGVLNLVNSIFKPSGDSAVARVQAFSGSVANVIASTLQFDAFQSTIPNSQFCPSYYPCNGAPLQVFADGEIRLQSSAISVLNDNILPINFPYSNQFDLQTSAPVSGRFTADPYSYVQPVTNQNADSLKILFNQPSLITALGAYTLDPNSSFLPTFYELPAGATPNTSGPLIGVVPNADNLNKLLNPIDNSVISTDVFGKPRTFNGKRDVGAVQTPGPLPVLGCGAAFGWSRRLRRRIRQ